eukprot:SAG11_NODE_9450_length_910_cov_1.505549_2_plen_59_part_00
MHTRRYAAKIIAEGYDEMQFLRDATADDIAELVEAAEMKKPHARTFTKALATLQERDV